MKSLKSIAGRKFLFALNFILPVSPPQEIQVNIKCPIELNRFAKSKALSCSHVSNLIRNLNFHGRSRCKLYEGNFFT